MLPLTRDRLGIDAVQLAAAITRLQDGDDGLARRVVTDDVVDELVVVGDAATVTAGSTGTSVSSIPTPSVCCCTPRVIPSAP